MDLNMKSVYALIILHIIFFTLGEVKNSNPLLKKKTCEVKDNKGATTTPLQTRIPPQVAKNLTKFFSCNNRRTLALSTGKDSDFTITTNGSGNLQVDASDALLEHPDGLVIFDGQIIVIKTKLPVTEFQYKSLKFKSYGFVGRITALFFINNTIVRSYSKPMFQSIDLITFHYNVREEASEIALMVEMLDMEYKVRMSSLHMTACSLEKNTQTTKSAVSKEPVTEGAPSNRFKKCSGATTKNVFLKSKRDDFVVLLKQRSKPSEVMNISNLIEGHSSLIKVKRHLEIKGKRFTGGFLIRNMKFEIMAKVAPSKLKLVFINSNFTKKISSKIATSERKKIRVRKTLIKRLPLLDKIFIFSRDTSFTIGKLFLDACAEEKRTRGNMNNNFRSSTIGEKMLPEPPSVNTPDWEKPQDYHQLDLDCCPEPEMLTTTTQAIPSVLTSTQPPPAPPIPDTLTVTLIIDSGLFNKVQTPIIAGILTDIMLARKMHERKNVYIGVVTFSDSSNEVFDKFEDYEYMYSEYAYDTFDYSLYAEAKVYNGIKEILEKVQPPPFNRTVDYTVGLTHAFKLLPRKVTYDLQLNMVLFMTSSPHTGCHMELFKAVSQLKQKAEFIYSFGIGSDVIEDEIKLINHFNGPFYGQPRLDNYEFVCQLSSKHPQVVNNLNVLLQGIYGNVRNEAAIALPEMISECLFESGPELPKILAKENLTTQWNATKDIFHFTVGVCEGIFQLIKDITNEAGRQIPFPKKETTKFASSLQNFLQFILEGKFILLSDSQNKKEKMEKWLDEEKKGLGKFYSKLNVDFGKFHSSVTRMAGVKKVQCMQSLLQKLSGNIEKLEDMLLSIRKLL